MSDELTAEIERLKAENKKLATDLASIGDELKDVRHEARDRRHENKTLTTQVAELSADRDKWKGQAEQDPDNLRKEVEAHKGTVRTMKHERAFEKVAAALKVNDQAKRADLFKLAGYAPEGDEPDEAKITATFQEALKGRSWLVDQPAPGGATTAPGGANGAGSNGAGGKPGPGNDRGQSLNEAPSQARERAPGRL